MDLLLYKFPKIVRDGTGNVRLLTPKLNLIDNLQSLGWGLHIALQRASFSFYGNGNICFHVVRLGSTNLDQGAAEISDLSPRTYCPTGRILNLVPAILIPIRFPVRSFVCRSIIILFCRGLDLPGIIKVNNTDDGSGYCSGDNKKLCVFQDADKSKNFDKFFRSDFR